MNILDEIQTRRLPWLTVGGQPMDGHRTATPDGFLLRTTGPRSVELHVKVDGERLHLELREPAPDGVSLPDRMRAAAMMPAVQILPGLFALEPNAPDDGFVLPIMEGIWMPASAAVVKATVKLYFVMGLSMGFWAACRRGKGTLVGLCDNAYLQFAMDGGTHGQRWIPEWLRDPEGKPLRLEIAWIPGEHWLDAAKEFRRHEFSSKTLVPLSQRPAARNLVGGANIKFHNYSRWDGQPEVKPYRFADVARTCRELKSAGLDRLVAIFWGWGKDGYDRLHPDFLPANPWAGGDAGLRQACDEIRTLGFTVGGHDNYQDIYEDAPSFGKGESVCVTPEGKPQPGGIWTGGQCFIQCSAEALRFAQRNLPEMKRRYGWEALFIDTTTAAHLYECFSATHPRSREDDRQDKIRLMDYARKKFGLFGSEAGFSWGAEYMDYWEGVTLIPLEEGGAKWWAEQMHARAIPIFGAVYRDVLTAYQHQSAGLVENAPLIFLASLRSGQPPYYWFTDGFYPKNTAYIRKSYEVLAHLHRLTVDATISGHEWLSADGRVEKTMLSDGTEIVTNMSAQPVDYLNVRLPGYGFWVKGPQIVAFWANEVAGLKFNPALWGVVRQNDFFTDRPTTHAAQLKELLQ